MNNKKIENIPNEEIMPYEEGMSKDRLSRSPKRKKLNSDYNMNQSQNFSSSSSPERKNDSSRSRSPERKMDFSPSSSPERKMDFSPSRSPERKMDSSRSRSPERKMDFSPSSSSERKMDFSPSSSPERKMDSSRSRSPERKMDSSRSRSPQRKMDSSRSRSPQRTFRLSAEKYKGTNQQRGRRIISSLRGGELPEEEQKKKPNWRTDLRKVVMGVVGAALVSALFPPAGAIAWVAVSAFAVVKAYQHREAIKKGVANVSKFIKSKFDERKERTRNKNDRGRGRERLRTFDRERSVQPDMSNRTYNRERGVQRDRNNRDQARNTIRSKTPNIAQIDKTPDAVRKSSGKAINIKENASKDALGTEIKNKGKEKLEERPMITRAITKDKTPEHHLANNKINRLNMVPERGESSKMGEIRNKNNDLNRSKQPNVSMPNKMQKTGFIHELVDGDRNADKILKQKFLENVKQKAQQFETGKTNMNCLLLYHEMKSVDKDEKSLSGMWNKMMSKKDLKLAVRKEAKTILKETVNDLAKSEGPNNPFVRMKEKLQVQKETLKDSGRTMRPQVSMKGKGGPSLQLNR